MSNIGETMLERVATMYRGGGDARSVAQRLTELKEQGCVALATGAVPSDAMQAIARRMFGDPSLNRRRLLVTFDPDPLPDEWLPEDVTTNHDTVMVRDHSEVTRDAVSADQECTESTTPSEDRVDVARPHLDAVTGDVLDFVGGLVAPRPGQVRVVVVRPDYLFSDRDRQSLSSFVDFVDRLRTLMQQFGGMALLVVSTGEDPGLVEELREHVDIQFQMRSGSAFVEQRVTIDPGSTESIRSDWHELP